MNFKSLLKAGIVAGGALGAAAASAVPVTFDFANNASKNSPTYYNTLELSQGGLDLDVDGYRDGFWGLSDAQIARSVNGLGVKGGDTNSEVDGGNGDELVVFDFSQEVEIQSISFMFFDGNDEAEIIDFDARLFWEKYVETITKDETSTNAGVSSFTFSDNFFTSLLGVGTTDGGDNFTIRSLTVNTKTAASVPEPSVIGLLGIGLIGLGMCRRRSSSMQA